MNFKLPFGKTGVTKLIENQIFGFSIIALSTFLIYYFALFHAIEPSAQVFVAYAAMQFVMLILSFVISSIIYLASTAIITMFSGYIRRNIPFKINKVIENGKEYVVKSFHSFEDIEEQRYYYRGKLHREKGSAIVSSHVAIPKFFLFGKEVDKKNFNQLLLQENINNFN